MKRAALLVVLAVLSFSFVAAQERGAVEIIGSGVNGRVLHANIIYQNARPGDYITVFNGIKLDTPRHLTQGDIDYSKAHYAEDTQVTRTIIKEIVEAPPPSPPPPLPTLASVPPQTIWGADLMTEFRAGSVRAAFYAIHEFLQSCNGKPDRRGLICSRIKPGDYLDLPALTVKADSGGGGFSAVNTSLGENRTLLRLIVVGVDSFEKTNSNAPAHVVFQFQNIPVNRCMNRAKTNKGGYAKSEMRRYLTTKFLPGLVAAGLPKSVIWAPTRYIANGGEDATAADALADKLWLPTEVEHRGSGSARYSNEKYETTQNQARLEFYESGPKSIKSGIVDNGTVNMSYWGASPNRRSAASFCILGSGSPSAATATGPGGCAPAFCVR